MAEEPSPDEVCDLGWAIGMVGRGYAAVVDPVFSQLPRGARGYQLLHTVIHKRIRSQNALADYLGVDRTVMPYLIDDLVTAGYVERRDDPADRRIRTVTATDEGRRCHRELSDAVARAEETLLGALRPAEREQFVEALSLVARLSRGITGSTRH